MVIPSPLEIAPLISTVAPITVDSGDRVIATGSIATGSIVMGSVVVAS
jgi:hypothetical protein